MMSVQSNFEPKYVPNTKYLGKYERSECIVVKMPTDEMSPLIYKDDDIIIHRQHSLEPGDIGVVVIQDKLYIRRALYFSDTNEVLLVSENPDYEPLLLSSKDVNEAYIFGKVISSRRKIVKNMY